jgi:hypothetical protein
MVTLIEMGAATDWSDGSVNPQRRNPGTEATSGDDR